MSSLNRLSDISMRRCDLVRPKEFPSKRRYRQKGHFITSKVAGGRKEGDVFYYHWDSIYLAQLPVFKIPKADPDPRFQALCEEEMATDYLRAAVTEPLSGCVDFDSCMEREEMKEFAELSPLECSSLVSTPSGVSGVTLAKILQGDEVDVKAVVAAEGQSYRVSASDWHDENDLSPILLWMAVARRLVPGSAFEKLKRLMGRVGPVFKDAHVDEFICKHSVGEDTHKEWKGRIDRKYEKIMILEAIRCEVYVIRREYMEGKCFLVDCKGFYTPSNEADEPGSGSEADYEEDEAFPRKGPKLKGVIEPFQMRVYSVKGGRSVRDRFKEDGDFAVCSSECSCNSSDSDSGGEGRRRRRKLNERRRRGGMFAIGQDAPV